MAPRKGKKKFQPVKRPGALTRKAKAAGESVSKFAKQHEHSPGLTGEQARFAENAKKWHHGKKKRGTAMKGGGASGRTAKYMGRKSKGARMRKGTSLKG